MGAKLAALDRLFHAKQRDNPFSYCGRSTIAGRSGHAGAVYLDWHFEDWHFENGQANPAGGLGGGPACCARPAQFAALFVDLLVKLSYGAQWMSFSRGERLGLFREAGQQVLHCLHNGRWRGWPVS